ncbi:MAG: FkbM family methyltransferase [Solirubrobacteraceae bacterium]
MELYRQEPEVDLLRGLVGHLEHRTLLDVGAERGEVAEALLGAGIERAHVFEPHPANINALRERFAEESRLTVHPYAVSDAGGVADLRLSVDGEGASLPFGHTLIERADTDAIQWRGTIPVELRSLASLVDSGAIPRRIGILKVDTEGNDLAVVRGMGTLEPDIVMVEHWTELPEGLGACPWTAEEIGAEMRRRGFNHFLFLIHRGEFDTFAWDDAAIETGAMGNLVFLHDRTLDTVLPGVVGVLAELAQRAVTVGQGHAHAAAERLAVIDDLVRTAAERLDLINEIERIAAERLVEIEQLRAQVGELETELAAFRAETR